MSAPVIHPPISPAIEVATPSPSTKAARLPSLDVFRGIVILAMLIVNNIGDNAAVGYFWSHADWKPVSLSADFKAWLGHPTFADFPLFHHCTLADFVMPMFMLIIGIALPFSVASQDRRKVPLSSQLWKSAKRAVILYAIGWLIFDISLPLVAYLHSAEPAKTLSFTLGMNVLQLLAVGFFLTRLGYLLPLWARLALAAALYAWHFALLKCLPQGAIPAGTFTEQHEAVGYLYHTLRIFHPFTIIPRHLSITIAGMLSAPPATATMLLGTFLGDCLRSNKPARTFLFFSLLCLTAGIALSFFLPMNKPRWTPGYLLYTTGVGTLLLTTLHLLLDNPQRPSHIAQRISLPFTILGTNAIGIYVLTILLKIYTLYLPRVTVDGKLVTLNTAYIHTLLSATTPQLGSWLYTLSLLAIVWLAATLAYKKNWIWKV